MFGYAVQKVAEDEAAAHNRAEVQMAEKEGREVQEIFYVTRSTMTFEVLDPEQTGAES